MSTPLSNAHRRELRTLTGLAQRDLSTLWRDYGNVVQSRDLLLRTLPRLVAVYGSAAATLGADYYDEARAVSGARGRFRAAPAAVVDESALEVLARVSVGSLFGAKPDPAAALTIASGGIQRHIANADRETVRVASVQDPKSKGWVRVGNGGCSWCQQFLDGEVHYSEGYGFDAHDHCNCTAVPSF